MDECYEFLSKLNALEKLSGEELAERIKAVTSRAQSRINKRKRFRIRLIAAITALFILMGSAVYTFYDEIEELFRTAKPGVHYSDENFDFETTKNVGEFTSIEDLTDSLDRAIWIPTDIPKGYEVILADVAHYSEYVDVMIIWEKSGDQIYYSAQLTLSYINAEQFYNHEFEYRSVNNHDFNIVDLDGDRQANTIIDDVYYTIVAKNNKTLYKLIDSMELSK